MSQQPPQPLHGDRVLVLKPRWLRLILGHRKSLEVRGSPLAAGPAWLGARGTIYGHAVLGPSFEIATAQQWANLRSQHRVEGPAPYPQPWASPLLHVRRLPTLQEYAHPQGAIGVVRFR